MHTHSQVQIHTLSCVSRNQRSLPVCSILTNLKSDGTNKSIPYSHNVSYKFLPIWAKLRCHETRKRWLVWTMKRLKNTCFLKSKSLISPLSWKIITFQSRMTLYSLKTKASCHYSQILRKSTNRFNSKCLVGSIIVSLAKSMHLQTKAISCLEQTSVTHLTISMLTVILFSSPKIKGIQFLLWWETYVMRSHPVGSGMARKSVFSFQPMKTQ